MIIEFPRRPLVRLADASVVVKWALEEAGRGEAIAVLDAYEAGRIDLVAPGVLREEVASALSKRCRRRQLTQAQAEAAFEFIEQRMPFLVQDADLTREALRISLRHHLSLWDCLYLALAIRYRCDLVTADERLVRAVRPHYPFVALLGV